MAFTAQAYVKVLEPYLQIVEPFLDADERGALDDLREDQHRNHSAGASRRSQG